MQLLLLLSQPAIDDFNVIVSTSDGIAIGKLLNYCPLVPISYI